MAFQRLGEFKTEFVATLIAIIFIIAGLMIPEILPDTFPFAVPGFQDTTWFKTIISVLLIGMGVVAFVWLVVIHRFILRKSKKDYMY
ncbi:hypothetical protein [Candidatus Hodarchaeum mangrovi]